MKNREQKRLEKLMKFFHHASLHPKLADKYAISYGNCSLLNQDDFIKANGIALFIWNLLYGNLKDTRVRTINPKEVKEVMVDGN